MQNKWITYGILTLMTIALVTLAYLQYSWLGSVSESEKDRLRENISASSENFIADFNQVFVELGRTFRIQVVEKNPDYQSLLADSYQNWRELSMHEDLIHSVYLIEDADTESPILKEFDPSSFTIKENEIDKEVQSWLDEYRTAKKSTIPLRVHPDFGKETFLSVPIQSLDMLRVRNNESGQNMEVKLSVEHLNDLVLLRLSNDYLRDVMIPDIARTYFSDSYEDRYHFSIVKNDDNRFVFYSTSDTSEIDDPEFRNAMDRYNFSNLVFFGSRGSELTDLTFPGMNDSLQITLNELKISEADEKEFPSNVKKGLHTSIITESKSNFRLQENGGATTVPQVQDTTIMSTMIGSITGSPWQLWISFKVGSLETFVNKTRDRNLAVSFGILSILGISVAFIVVFSQRSKQLADQQMMFVAGVSHELRTPVTVIRSAAENLKEGVIQDANRREEYASLMLKEGRRLSDMIDQIMEFSGIQSEKRNYHFRPVQIDDFIELIKEKSLPVIEDAGIKLEYTNEIKSQELLADSDALFLAVSNLVNNAVKFSGESDLVRLRFDEVVYKGKTAFRIQVQDYGMGIPEEEQKDIFKPFFRGQKPVSDQLKGNGIGLSLVQKIAKAHNGTVEVRSETGKGSIFNLIIPKEN